jgi:hypothetical protein
VTCAKVDWSKNSAQFARSTNYCDCRDADKSNGLDRHVGLVFNTFNSSSGGTYFPDRVQYSDFSVAALQYSFAWYRTEAGKLKPSFALRRTSFACLVVLSDSHVALESLIGTQTA